MREMNVTSYVVENLFKKVITTLDKKFLFPKKIENTVLCLNQAVF